MAVILGLALLLRLAAILATPDLPLVSDPADYARHARSIAGGHGYPESLITGGPTAVRPPAFPVLLAAVFAVSGDSVGAARVLQALLGVLVVMLVALVARELWGPRVGLFAGALAAVFPPLAVVGMPLFSEPLFVALELGAIFAVLRWRARQRPSPLLLAGVLLGLAILTRPNGALLLPALLFAGWTPGRWRSPRSYAAPALILACAAVVVAPWTIRNAVVMKAFVPVSDQDGYTLAGTYNETSRGLGGAWIPATLDPALRRYVERHRSDGEVELGSALRTRARHFAIDHPGYLATVARHNVLQLFSLRWKDEKTGQRVGAGLGSEWAGVTAFGLYPFLLLALLGLFTGAWRRAPWWFWAIPVLMLSVVMVVASSRFRAPVDPFLLFLAAGGAVWIVDRARRPGA